MIGIGDQTALHALLNGFRTLLSVFFFFFWGGGGGKGGAFTFDFV
jgi:hypothetical protein